MIEKKYKNKKVSLRRLKISDVNFIYTNAKDKEIIKFTYIFPPPFTKERAKDFIKKAQTLKKHKIFFEFAIEMKKNKKIIGTVNIFNINQKNKQAEVGIWIAKKFWGKGLAKEAMELLINFCFTKLKMNKIKARVFDKNTSAQKLLKAVSFKLEKRLTKRTFFHNQSFKNLIYVLVKNNFDKSV